MSILANWKLYKSKVKTKS